MLIEKEMKEGGNPRDAKMKLGYEIVKLYHGETAAIEAQEGFIAQFSEGKRPENIPQYTPSSYTMNIVDFLVESNLESSKGNARRVVEQGGVKIDDQKIIDPQAVMTFQSEMVIQVGKRRFIEIM